MTSYLLLAPFLKTARGRKLQTIGLQIKRKEMNKKEKNPA